MNRAKLFAAVEMAHAAAHNATLAASYDKVKPERAEEFAIHAEAAAYAVLDALAMARLSIATEADWRAVA
jgi:hypothetical protein